MMSNSFNPAMSLGLGNEELENINESLFMGKSKKMKNDDEVIGSNRFASINPNAFGNNLNIEDILHNPQLGGSNIFNNLNEFSGFGSVNNKTSIDFIKFFNNTDFQTLALPHSTIH